jgi:hypothetical protein
MIKHIEQCSKCKAYVNGEAQRLLSRKIISRGTSSGINKLLGWAIVSPIVGSIVPVVGTFFGYIISLFLLLKAKSYSDRISNKIYKSLFEYTTYQFVCPTCGNTWTNVLETALSEIPDAVLEVEKERKERSCKLAAGINGSIALLSGLTAIYTFLYCCIEDATIHTGIKDSYFFGSFERIETNWLWWFSGLFFMVSVVITFLKYNAWKRKRKEYKAIQEMNLKQFMTKYFA